jgi:hypothetical protein
MLLCGMGGIPIGGAELFGAAYGLFCGCWVGGMTIPGMTIPGMAWLDDD